MRNLQQKKSQVKSRANCMERCPAYISEDTVEQMNLLLMAGRLVAILSHAKEIGNIFQVFYSLT